MTAADDTRSLTYAELGKARGISPASAKRLALRHGWHKEPGNDGLARVRVPVTWLETPPVTEAVRHLSDMSPVTVPVAMLARVQQDAENAVRAAEAERDASRAETAEVWREAEQHRERAARAEGEVAGLREAMHRADAATERAEEGRRTAEAERDASRAEAAARRDAEASARAQADVERQAREVAERELAERTAGGPLARAWRALAFRRERP